MASLDNAMITRQPLLVKLTRHSDVVLAIMIVCIIGILILPLPPTVLDFLLAFNITLSLVVLLVTMYIRQPLELSVFPGLLLILTLFRLSLNVASTRLILGTAYAGEVIESFGNFVVAGNYIVGFIVFSILVIIQFVVITKGAGRIADLIKERLGVGHAETTEDLKFTAEYVACIGACGMAPVIMVNDGTYGSLTVQKTDEVIQKYQQMD